MNEKYQMWLSNSEEYKRALLHVLEKCSDKEYYFDDKDVAFAFPSTDPNPFYFDIPRIDDVSLQSWATSNGWSVELISELNENNRMILTKVRFIRIQ